MKEPSEHPSRDEIMVVLAHLGDRVASDRARTLDPIIRISLHRVITELRARHIPGLYDPPDEGVANALAAAATDALRRSKWRLALSRSLRGLSFSPHNVDLWYHVGSASLQFGDAEIAVRSFQHALWIHPGFLAAKRDLEALAELDKFWTERQLPDQAEPRHPLGESDYNNPYDREWDEDALFDDDSNPRRTPEEDQPQFD